MPNYSITNGFIYMFRKATNAVSLFHDNLWTPVPCIQGFMKAIIKCLIVDWNCTNALFLSVQNRPSVITCASGNNRNCNLSHCPIAHNGCVPAMPQSYRRPSNCKLHFQSCLCKQPNCIQSCP